MRLGVTEEMLKQAEFGKVVVTRRDLLKKQNEDPFFEINPEAVRAVIREKYLREAKDFTFQIFTDNVLRFRESATVTLLLIVSKTQVLSATRLLKDEIRTQALTALQQ